MVWSQYVDEANIGFDACVSDDDEFNNEHTPLNIEDWEVEYSDELHHMWNTMITLLDDAYIGHSGKFCDFVEFCYEEHDSYQERTTSEHEEQLHYIWKHLRRIINMNGLHEEMMRGVTFYHFVDFAENYMSIY
jgi:hypothetical protein